MKIAMPDGRLLLWNELTAAEQAHIGRQYDVREPKLVERNESVMAMGRTVDRSVPWDDNAE